MRTDFPTAKTRSTDSPANWGNMTLMTSRSHAPHDHKGHDPGTTRHADPRHHAKWARATATWPLTGVGILNPAVVSVAIRAADDGSSKLVVRGAAKEGLIRQRAGEAAARRVAEASA
jgi:hypothetical protein